MVGYEQTVGRYDTRLDGVEGGSIGGGAMYDNVDDGMDRYDGLDDMGPYLVQVQTMGIETGNRSRGVREMLWINAWMGLKQKGVLSAIHARKMSSVRPHHDDAGLDGPPSVTSSASCGSAWMPAYLRGIEVGRRIKIASRNA